MAKDNTIDGLAAKGDPARLIPVLPDSRREERVTSVLMAVLQSVDEYGRDLLSAAGAPIRKRTTIEYKISDCGDGRYTVSYVPTLAGRWELSLICIPRKDVVVYGEATSPNSRQSSPTGVRAGGATLETFEEVASAAVATLPIPADAPVGRTPVTQRAGTAIEGRRKCVRHRSGGKRRKFETHFRTLPY